jgi:hypothetical protein
MSNQVNSAGYGGGIKGSIFAPDRISSKIVVAYQQCSLLPAIAKSDFMSNEELMCGGKVIYGIEQTLNLFGTDRQNNEHPDVFDGPGIDTNSLTICQGRKFEWKLSNYDRRIMCDNFDLWEESVKRRLDNGVRQLIDAYSIPKIMASASPDNVGNRAGKISHSIDLGWQDATALNANSIAGMEELFYNLRQVAQEAGMMGCAGNIDTAGPGYGGAIPVVILPVQLERWAIKLMSEFGKDGCCTEKNAFVTGYIGKILGFEVFTSSQLFSSNFGAAGNLAPVLMLDPTQVLHAFEVIDSKWYEGKFEWSLVGEFVWDTHVIRSEAVAVAWSKV